jgi:hypothetical protein
MPVRYYGYLPSQLKTGETAFQVLNMTVWTNNKGFKSRMRPDPKCKRCREVETMEHLLCDCMHYVQLLRVQLGEIITQHLKSSSQNLIPKVEITQLNVIYNVSHPSLLRPIQDKLTKNAFLILTQEIKCDIIYR